MSDRFGRNAAQPIRYGRRSILYAVCAFAVTLGMFVAAGLTADTTSHVWKEATSTAAVIAFLLVAPILHLIGFYFGARGLFAPTDCRTASSIGALLNIGLVALGAYLLWLILPAATAFR